MMNRTIPSIAIVTVAAGLVMGLAADQPDAFELTEALQTDATIEDELSRIDGVPMAGSGVGYNLSWHTIDGGGGTSAGGAFQLSGTIGQPDAGVMSGGDYTLAGGFWAGGAIDLEPECPIPADLNCDGVVDGLDLLTLLSAWGDCVDPGDCPADLNDDGAVDGLDLLILLSNWGE